MPSTCRASRLASASGTACTPGASAPCWPGDSGGGLKMGQVIGSTNARGEHPKDTPLRVTDLWATMFRHLGIDCKNTSFLDHQGRPMPMLPDGKPIAGLV